MKTLFLSVLIAALSITGNHRKAHAAVVQELCVNGKVSSTTTPAQGPSIAITNCEWALSATIASDPSTAKSIAVSGGTTLGVITIDVGTAVNPMSISLTNGFTMRRAIFKGELSAGSSVTIKDCVFKAQEAYGIDFISFTLGGSDFVFFKNLVMISVNARMMQLPSCKAKCTFTIDENVFNYTVAGGQFGIFLPSKAHSLTFSSRRNRFLAVAGFNGYRIAPPTAITSTPANWSLVSDQDARDVYGKSTYVIADNDFENFTRPWSFADPDGADVTIENNTVRTGTSSSNPPDYTYSGNYYRLKTVIRNNTLRTSGIQLVFFDINLKTLPLYSSVLVQNNTVTNDKSLNPRIVRLSGPAIYNDTALLEVSHNVLLSTNGTTGLMNNTVYSIYSSIGYTAAQLSLIAASAPVMLFGNTLFGVPIDTYELTYSTVYFSNRSRMLKIGSPYPEPTTTTDEPTTTTTAEPTTTTTTDEPTTTTMVSPTPSSFFSYSEEFRRASPLCIWISAVTLGVSIFLARAVQ